MNKLLFLLLSAAVTVAVTAGITHTDIQKNSISHKATAAKLTKATHATGAATPTVPGQFHGWDRQASHALRSDHAITWDFEDENQFDEFNCIDNDGDGFNWYYITNADHEWDSWMNYETHSGDGIVCSKSYYQEDHRPLTPDNWLISPRMILGTTLSFFAMGQDDNDCYEKFGVYVCVGTPTGVDDFVQLGNDFTTTDEYQEFVVDLSAYEGQVGHFAIVHHNVSGQFILNIDDITTDGNILPPPETPEVRVTPRSTTAVVEWDAGEGELNWNLRYRLWRDILGNPLDCDFNDENYDLKKAGWTLDDADGDGRNWRVDNGHLYSESYDPTADVGLYPNNYLYSPEIKLQGILRFTYWEISDLGRHYFDRFMVYAQIGEEMHPLADEDYVATRDRMTETIDLNQFGGQVGRIVFRHYNCKNEYALGLDDIFIGNPDAELIEPAEWTEVKALTTPNYTIKGLTLQTKYEVQVMAYNVVKPSDWSKIVDFTTLEEGADVFELGDVNHDFEVNITDVTNFIAYLLDNSNIIYKEQADTYGDEAINITDVTSLITYLMSGSWPVVEHVYTVVGTYNLFGEDWDLNCEQNNMVKGDDGIYRLTKAGWFQEGTEIYFKVVQDHSYTHSWPAENFQIGVYKTGAFNFEIVFNPYNNDEDKVHVIITEIF